MPAWLVFEHEGVFFTTVQQQLRLHRERRPATLLRGIGICVAVVSQVFDWNVLTLTLRRVKTMSAFPVMRRGWPSDLPASLVVFLVTLPMIICQIVEKQGPQVSSRGLRIEPGAANGGTDRITTQAG